MSCCSAGKSLFPTLGLPFRNQDRDTEVTAVTHCPLEVTQQGTNVTCGTFTSGSILDHARFRASLALICRKNLSLLSTHRQRDATAQRRAIQASPWWSCSW